MRCHAPLIVLLLVAPLLAADAEKKTPGPGEVGDPDPMTALIWTEGDRHWAVTELRTRYDIAMQAARNNTLPDEDREKAAKEGREIMARVRKIGTMKLKPPRLQVSKGAIGELDTRRMIFRMQDGSPVYQEREGSFRVAVKGFQPEKHKGPVIVKVVKYVPGSPDPVMAELFTTGPGRAMPTRERR